MKAQFVNENINFERGTNPMDAMEVGRNDRRQNEKHLYEIGEIVGMDLSQEMNQMLDLLDLDDIAIQEVDPEYTENPEGWGKSRLWVTWNPRNRSEEFPFLQFPRPLPRRWARKYGKSVWDKNDPKESGHNGQVIESILGEMIFQTKSEYPERLTDDVFDFKKLAKDLAFLKGK